MAPRVGPTTKETRLATAALGVFDFSSVRTMEGVRAREPRAATVQVSARALADLMDALDAWHPGIMDRYLSVRKHNDERERDEAKAKARAVR